MMRVYGGCFEKYEDTNEIGNQTRNTDKVRETWYSRRVKITTEEKQVSYERFIAALCY